jgi:hypothetical protein
MTVLVTWIYWVVTAVSLVTALMGFWKGVLEIRRQLK